MLMLMLMLMLMHPTTPKCQVFLLTQGLVFEFGFFSLNSSFTVFPNTYY